MKDTRNIFALRDSQNYIPVIFKEKDIINAIATAMHTESNLLIWNEENSEWEIFFAPLANDKDNKKWLGKHGILWEEHNEEWKHNMCRFDVMFQKTDAYYYNGAGIIVLPERFVIERYSLFNDTALPICPLSEYDIYSDADFYEMEQLLHDMPPYVPEELNYDDQESHEEEFSFEKDPKFHRVYTYQPYTHWRLKQILNDYYGANMVCVRGYKEGRYQPGYKQRYNIYWNASGKLAAKNIHLDTLRYIFAEKEFPLHEPDIGRNHKAQMFLNIVQRLAKQQKNR